MTTPLKQAFERWWETEGSTAPKPGDDMYEHCMRMCEAAWFNGAYIAQQPGPKVATLVIREGGNHAYVNWSKMNMPKLPDGVYPLHVPSQPTERKS